jgi:2-keto-3-deoxy-L-rhamnonate aldolase RhmA
MSLQPGFSHRLRTLQPLVGTVVTVPDVALAELTASAVDFIWIDLEHSALSVSHVQPLAVAARAADAAVVVRLASANAEGLNAILDAGVDGVAAPRVESAAEAVRLVEALRYPPHGSRGFAARRANAYGRRARPASSSGLACMVQIESPRGVEQADTIAAVEGVDALVVGCADLSLALGSPDLTDAIDHVQRAAAEAGIASGIAGPDDASRLAGLADGRSTVLVLSADVRLYARAVEGAVDGLRQRLAPQREAVRVGA